jgi:hypothetical protein
VTSATELFTLEKAMLRDPVRRLLNSDIAEVVDWTAHRLGGGMDSHVVRVEGTARDRGQARPWSLVVKIALDNPGLAGSRSDPGLGFYWKREALLYGSGLLDHLTSGFVPPRCFGVDTPDAATALIWLEDVVETGDQVWPVDRYGMAARHIGAFNGDYLVGRPVPAAAWLPEHRLRDYYTAWRRNFERLPQAHEHPLVRRSWSDALLDRVQRLSDERERHFQALERLPPTFCHHDVFRGNLFARRRPDGTEDTVAIDWAYSGRGAIGEDLSTLLAGSIFMCNAEPDQVQQLDAVIFSGYVAGLREAGWNGDARLPRLGYAASTALHWGLAAPSWSVALDESLGPFCEQLFRRPLPELLDRWASMVAFACDLGDEAGRLIDELGLG